MGDKETRAAHSLEMHHVLQIPAVAMQEDLSLWTTHAAQSRDPP